MFIRRIMVGSALAAGIGVAGMIGAGTASAAPGISYDPGPGDPIGIGDNSATGAQADASNNNQALAISVFRPATATADGQNRTGNTVFALDGTAGFLKTHTSPYTDDHDNQVVAINGTAMAHGEGTNLVAIGSNVSNKLTVTYVDGTRDYTYGRWANPYLGFATPCKWYVDNWSKTVLATDLMRRTTMCPETAPARSLTAAWRVPAEPSPRRVS